MNVLSREKQIQIITALVEGCSIRSIERMYDVHRDTIMRLMVRTGDHCMTLMDDLMHDIPAGTIQVDEMWTYVHKKDKRLMPSEKHNPEIGSQFIFIAMDADTKLIPSYRIGKRIQEVANGLMVDLAERINGRPRIITDGFIPYIEAVETAFGAGADFAQLVKVVSEIRRPVREGYTPATVVRCTKTQISGNMDKRLISTSLIERQNLGVRMSMRRLGRLTNAFSKKLENLKAAAAVHFCWYNLGKVHGTLRCTPAMAAGLVSSIWEIENILPTTA